MTRSPNIQKPCYWKLGITLHVPSDQQMYYDIVPKHIRQHLLTCTQQVIDCKITWQHQTIPHFHSKEFVILPRQHAALNGYSEIEIIWSTYVTSTFPCAMAPTTNTAGVSFGNLSTNSRSVTILGALWENPTLSQFGGKYLVTGPLTICREPVADVRKGVINLFDIIDTPLSVTCDNSLSGFAVDLYYQACQTLAK